MKRLSFLVAAVGLLYATSSAQDVSVLYSQDFSTDDSFNAFAVVDANDDGCTWERKTEYNFSTGETDAYAHAKFSSANTSDDWLFMPVQQLRAGNTYTLKFDLFGGGSFFPERIEVKIGTAPTTSAMTGELLAPLTVTQTVSDPSRQSLRFSVDGDGEYYIGFHCISDKDQFGLSLDNIVLEGPANQDPGVETVPLPYSQTFDTPAAFDDLTIINANQDNKTWEYKDQKAWLQYDAQNASDDWLILPAMRMDADKAYILNFETWAHQGNFFPERIEVKIGKGPEAASMTSTVLEPTMLTNKEDEPVRFECPITVTDNGVYYIGFHGISDADRDGVFLDNILVSERSLDVPAEPTNLNVTADPAGENSATIVFNAPATTLTGKPLTQIEKIVILRGEEEIKTFDNPTPGARIEYTDNTASRGLTTYRVVAFSPAGRGSEAFTTLFVGINTPAPVPSVTVTESASKPGQVTLTWGVPTTDVDGNPINTDKITYEVVERNGIYTQTVIKSGIKGTSYTYQSLPVGETQRFQQWGVYSYTDNGTKHDTRTDMIVIGTPYTAPYTESFANGTATSITSNLVDGVETQWLGLTDEDKVGAAAQDGDNGFSGLVTEDQGDFAQLTLGKVSIKDVSNPGLSFYLYNPTGGLGANLDMLAVQISTGKEWEDLFSCRLENLAKEDRWNRVMVSLEDYKDQTVQIRFMCGVENGGLILVDNIYIGELYAQNIGATSINIPAKVKPDTDFTLGVTVENLGTESFENYDVVLYRMGTEIARKPGVKVEVCDEAVINFTDRLNTAMDDKVFYEAEIIASHDQNASDNKGRRAAVELVRSTLPAPQELNTEVNEADVTLRWLEPDFSQSAVEQITESFEVAQSWAINEVDGWTFVDGDGGETYSLSGYDYPGKNSKMAYQVFDSASEPFATETGFDANSGNKYMVSFASKTHKNDDWMISPRLTGEAQRISFAASSFNVGEGYTYYESFEVLYSTSGTDIADFQSLATIDQVPARWTNYSYDLPQGALYFAIRCTSENKYIFMVDDVTFAPYQIATREMLRGYNIYRDSRRLNDAPVSELTYIDRGVAKGDHTYVVTAIFDNEESNISNLATAFVETDALTQTVFSDVTITATEGTIVVTGNAEATVYTPAGIIIATIPAAQRATLAVAPGLYIVRAGDKTVKFVVR